MSPVRIPFPVKVLLSYLAVVLAGAVPILVHLERRFSHELTAFAADSLVEHARLVARTIGPLTVDDRLSQVRFIATTSLERFTYMDGEGFVLYDSQVSDLRQLDNHRDRPEVVLALGAAEARAPFDPGIPGTGVARRMSVSTDASTLYAAAVVAPPTPEGAPHVLRLALPVKEVESLTDALRAVFGNSLALSLSVAIFLSLASALVFLRPMQRVVTAALALAEGDYTAAPSRLGNDEIGDVGRALKQLGIELRRRLAHAEAGSAMLTQLVETVSVPLAIFDSEGAAVAINGAARELLGAVGETEEDRLDAFVSHDVIRAARRRCMEAGRPESVKLSLGKDGLEVRGWLSSLERPERPPFMVFLGRATYRPAGSRLPKPSHVRVVQLADVVGSGLSRATPVLRDEGLSPPEPGEVPRAWVSDAYGRLAMAVSLAAEESARLAARGTGELIPLAYTLDDGVVAVVLPGSLGSEAIANLRMLLEPLGGEVRVEGSRAELLLARA